jgi:hypothetical protein
VLLFAPEGAGSIALRLAALVENKIEPRSSEIGTINLKRLPFEWTNTCPLLLGNGKIDPLPILTATAAAAHERFQQEFGLPLALILIDTMATATGWTDENDNAQASRAMAVLRDLSIETGAVVMGVDHLGKNAEAGARGASAKEANADFVLASVGEKRADGRVENSELNLRKLRDGPQGLTIPFEARVVDMGQDEHSYPVTSCVIDWNVQRRPKEKKLSESELLLSKALGDTLAAKGEMVEGMMRARRDDVRVAFYAAYKPTENLDNDAKAERWRKALKSHGSIETRTIGDVAYLSWVERPF